MFTSFVMLKFIFFNLTSWLKYIRYFFQNQVY